MNSPGKSTGFRSSPEAATRHWGEDMARLHCLQVLFPDWTGEDPFLLRQLKESIETTLREDASEDTFENFSAVASSLRDTAPTPFPASHAFIRIDFSGRTWEPLFARQEIIRKLKPHAGTGHIFLLVRGLRRALFPDARYRTRAREAARTEATRFIDDLVRHWSTPSSTVHVLYV
ncbi:MAG: hypothetical protein ACP5I4_04575 [Oceanipulchritudo sp.]